MTAVADAIRPEPSFSEMAIKISQIASMREHMFERAPIGAWLIHSDGTAILNREARKLVGDPDGPIDFGKVEWRTWHLDGSDFDPSDWPASKGFQGIPSRDVDMVILGPWRGPYGLRVTECRPVYDGKSVVGVVLFTNEIEIPPGPWDTVRYGI